MQVVFVRPFTDAGIRVYQTGDVGSFEYAKAQNLISHGIARPHMVVQIAEKAVPSKVKREKR